MSAEKPPAIPRTLWHIDTDEDWAKRDIGSKVHVTAKEAAWRLRGLGNVLFGLGIHDHHNRNAMAFLGNSVNDIALALERVTKAQSAKWDAETDKLVKRLPAPTRKARRRAAA
jgi:hypothetical protein